jgi:glutamine cyclotransferase
VFLACGEEDPSRKFSLDLEGDGKKYKIGAVVSVRVKNRSELQVDSVAYELSGIRLPYTDGSLTLSAKRPGTHLLRATAYSGETEIPMEKEVVLLPEAPPEIYTYEILNSYPHDIEAFTQGLEFRGDTLYESTGQKGASSLRKVDFKTGEILAMAELERTYFGEGITILGDSLYMLTWQSKIGFIYDPENLQRLGSFNYSESKEGWGLCNDGKQLYKSDGSERIWLLNPQTLQEEDYIETVTNKSVFNKANELEYVDGKIYANVWQKPSMMIIDAKSGIIEGVVNFGGLEQKVTQHPARDVFIGVAFHKERGTFFVTGKRWDRLFEVRIVKREP